LGPGGQEPQAPEPMEIDPPDPSGRVWTVQRLAYYISEVLHHAKMRYLDVHKLLYVVLIASRKLHHYFQAHKISVVTSYLLKVVLHSPNATGNIAKWAAELVEFELDFLSCHTVKSQALADFVADWTPPPCNPGGPDDSEPEAKAPVFTEPHWTLFFDGSSRWQTSWQTGHHHHATQGAQMIASQKPRLRSSPSLTGRSSLMAPRESRVPERGPAPHS
jgi:hypothetical protein